MATVSHPPSQQEVKPQQSSVPPAYFVDTKKGEVSELKQLLKNISAEKDAKRKRDVLKKVIAYMTLGIDVSRLFTEMVMAIETRDLVVKKMVYLYLCNYAHAKPDLAIMCVNTLQRDCSSDDPMVRGLALRSLCSLRLPSMVEYIWEPLRRSLTDSSAYVRKTGVMGILKLHHLAPEMVRNANMVEVLYKMMQDPDVHVISNCLIVLNEMLAEEGGGLNVNQALILHLLSRVGEFNEWELTNMLTLVVTHYTPADEEELFTIMNLLDPVLRTSNSGVVLATIKCFLHLTESIQDLQPQIYLRVKAPVLTLMAGGKPEVDYCVLKHLQAMIHRAGPGIFDDEYRQLYVRYNEPSFVKYEKIDILALIANAESVNDIVGELAEHATDVNQEVSRRSIQAIGRVAFRLPEASSMIISRLIEFLDYEMNNVRAETILVMKDLLRKYPDRRTEVLPSLQPCLRRVEEAEARAALIWMTAEYGEELSEAPYILEPVIDNYAEIESPLVKLNLLTATMKLFFKRPPEVQSILGRLLASATNDTSCQDLHDRALLYYRLLTTDLEVAKTVILGNQPRQVIRSAFAEERDVINMRERLFTEFNSLSILYEKPSSEFVSPNYQFKMAPQLTSPLIGSGTNGGGGGGGEGNKTDYGEDDLLLPPTDDEDGDSSRTRGNSVGGGAGAYAGVDLLLDMAAPSGDGSPALSEAESGTLNLMERFVLDAEAFQNMWTSFGDGEVFHLQLSRLPNGLSELEGSLASRNIITLASGDLPDVMKLFLYAQDGQKQQQIYLVQALVYKSVKKLEVTIKAQGSSSRTEAFVDLINQALYSLGLV